MPPGPRRELRTCLALLVRDLGGHRVAVLTRAARLDRQRAVGTDRQRALDLDRVLPHLLLRRDDEVGAFPLGDGDLLLRATATLHRVLAFRTVELVDRRDRVLAT